LKSAGHQPRAPQFAVAMPAKKGIGTSAARRPGPRRQCSWRCEALKLATTNRLLTVLVRPSRDRQVLSARRLPFVQAAMAISACLSPWLPRLLQPPSRGGWLASRPDNCLNPASRVVKPLATLATLATLTTSVRLTLGALLAYGDGNREGWSPSFRGTGVRAHSTTSPVASRFPGQLVVLQPAVPTGTVERLPFAPCCCAPAPSSAFARHHPHTGESREMSSRANACRGSGLEKEVRQ
jgi:hypothetical protein